MSEDDLSKAQLNRIEKNKQRALTLRQSRLTAHPYSKGLVIILAKNTYLNLYFLRDVVSIDKTTIKIGSTKYKDTGAGFLLEETEPEKPVSKAMLFPETILKYTFRQALSLKNHQF